jgi:L-aminopeptidase/D-esterase-like protein
MTLPAGFEIGHWTDETAATGCTVVLAPPDGAVASGEARGGGTGSREMELLHPLANAARVHAVLLTGGSAFGLAAADGVMSWLERNDRGYATPGGRVPLVPAAVVYDLITGDSRRRPGPADGEAACAAASADPLLGSVGAGTGAAVGKLLGRERAVKGGVGLAVTDMPQGQRLAALAVVNAFGDVLGEDGAVMAGPRGADGRFLSTTGMIRGGELGKAGFRSGQPPGNTTLVCLMTDAQLTKPGCGIVAKMAHAGMARAVDPVHSAADGDVVFALATGAAAEVDPMIAGIIGAAVTAEAIRDGVRQARGVAGIPGLAELRSSG